MRVTIKGQVTIPLPIRRASGIEPGTEVAFSIGDDGVVQLRRAAPAQTGTAVVAALHGRATAGLSTEEIMRLTRE